MPHPKLRAVEARPMNYNGQPMILLRDPLGLSDRALFVPQHMAPLLALCDGTRDAAALQASLAVRFGIRVAMPDLEHILAQMDEVLLFDNERFAQARAAALRDYRAAPWRTPLSAGSNYPADPEELERALESYIEAAGPTEEPAGAVRGLICPHIDYQRGGTVYAQVWAQVAEAARAAELVIIFGTDHNSDGPGLTFTRQQYATPWGVLPTARPVVDAVAEAIGEEAAFGQELHHRGEHSVELAAVWLHYLRRGQPCPIVPILCGSFQPFVDGQRQPAEDAVLSAALDALRVATAPHRTLVVAAADLAHMGPAFGDGFPIDFVGRTRLQAADEQLVAAICTGDAEAVFQNVAQDGDQRRICGLPPIYATLKLLGKAAGRPVGYTQCPADQQGTSVVSICGVVLEDPQE